MAVPASRRAPDGITLDAGDDASVSAGIGQLLDRDGRVDGLVVTAAPSARTLDSSKNNEPEQLAKAFDGKVLTFLRLANSVLPVMREAGYGRIVGISGQNAFKTGNLTGSVRNAAVIVAGKNLADAAAGTGVTVNVGEPGDRVRRPVEGGPSGGVRRDDTGRDLIRGRVPAVTARACDLRRIHRRRSSPLRSVRTVTSRAPALVR